MEEPLSIKDVHDRLIELPGWEMPSHTEIAKEFEFKDFKEAVGFAQKVGEEAERNNHHPDILIRNSKVLLTLTTREDNGLTYMDFKLAKIIEQLL